MRSEKEKKSAQEACGQNEMNQIKTGENTAEKSGAGTGIAGKSRTETHAAESTSGKGEAGTYTTERNNAETRATGSTARKSEAVTYRAETQDAGKSSVEMKRAETYGAEKSRTETRTTGSTARKNDAETLKAERNGTGTGAARKNEGKTSTAERNKAQKNNTGFVTERTGKGGLVFGWKCQECGKIFIGRSGQKFCSLECKNKFNNRRNSKIRRYKAGIIRRLGKNYEILQSMMHSRCRSFKLEDLNALGFDRNCVTGYDTSGKKKIYRCYDIKYSLSENRLYDIQREELLDD